MSSSLVTSSRIRRISAIATPLALAAILSSCASSQLVNLWKDPVYPREPMTNVLVVALKESPANRRIWEDNFAASMEKIGVKATPSYRLFPNALPDTQQVIEAVRSNGYDGVVVTHQLETATLKTRVPGYTTMQPVTVQNPWTGWYQTVYQQVRHRGYVETERIVQHQTDVWSTKDGGRMVWTGVSQVIDPSSADAVYKDITKMIVPELVEQHVLPTAPRK